MTACTDDERREVARRLRELARDVDEVSDFDLARTFGLEATSRYGYDSGDVLRLADLIEPSIPKDPGKAGLACVDAFIREMRHSTEEERGEYSAMLKKMSVELHPVDRDALLALADEMDKWALICDHYDRQVSPLDVAKYARRIREALGVSE